MFLDGPLRLDPDRPVAEAGRQGRPGDAWIALCRTCPSAQTSLRVAKELRAAGWGGAVAAVGRWDEMRAAGFAPEAKRVAQTR